MLDCKTHFNGVITVVLLPALNTRVYNNVAPTDLWSDYYTGSAKAEVLVALQRINNKMCQPQLTRLVMSLFNYEKNPSQTLLHNAWTMKQH